MFCPTIAVDITDVVDEQERVRLCLAEFVQQIGLDILCKLLLLRHVRDVTILVIVTINATRTSHGIGRIEELRITLGISGVERIVEKQIRARLFVERVAELSRSTIVIGRRCETIDFGIARREVILTATGGECQHTGNS